MGNCGVGGIFQLLKICLCCDFFFTFFFFLMILFISGSAGPLLLHRLFSGCGKQGLLSEVCRLLIVVASPVAVCGI